MDNDSIINSLISLKSDEKYRDFIASLVPTISKEKIIGVKTPAIRSFAKTLFINNNYEEFLNKLPHFYLEENMLHSILISFIKDKDEANFRLNQFLDYIDNWAVCDCFKIKAIEKDKVLLLKIIKDNIKSKKPYRIRFAIVNLMRYFLDDKYFKSEYLTWVRDVKSDDYYVKIAVAWFYSVAFIKQVEETLTYFLNNDIDIWIRNKAIQKSKESKRLTNKQKEIINSLKK